MSAFEIKIVSPELAAALNNLADAIRGQGEIIPRTSTVEVVKTEEPKAEPKPKPKAEPKPKADPKPVEPEADAGDAEPVEDTKASSTSQDDSTEVTPDQLAKAITTAAAAGKRTEVVAILATFKAKRGSDITDAEDRASAFEQIEALTQEG